MQILIHYITTFFIFFILGIIWQTSSSLNLFIKITLISMAIWTLLFIIKNPTIIKILTGS
jgi:hypothetical protein